MTCAMLEMESQSRSLDMDRGKLQVLHRQSKVRNASFDDRSRGQPHAPSTINSAHQIVDLQTTPGDDSVNTNSTTPSASSNLPTMPSNRLTYVRNPSECTPATPSE